VAVVECGQRGGDVVIVYGGQDRAGAGPAVSDGEGAGSSSRFNEKIEV
jgi:hypothetical protein